MANPISSTISTVTGILKNMFKTPQTPQTPPGPLIAIGAGFKQGLSASEIASKIIDKKKQYGIPTGPLPSGGDNIDLIMETIRVEVIIDYFIKNATVVTAIPPGAINSSGYGTSVNTNFIVTKGYIR
jgi:hypothetical protein